MSDQKKSMALAYNLSKRNKRMCAHGGPAECAEGCYAKGGEVDAYSTDMEPEGEDDLVGRIIKRMSKGGMVANDDEPIADSMPADYDDLAMDDHLEQHTHSSNEHGDEQESDDRKDIVSRVMASRRKKDRNPRPA